MNRPEGISQGQLSALTSLFNNMSEFPNYHGTFRVLQPRNSRQVVFYQTHIMEGNNHSYRHRFKQRQWVNPEVADDHGHNVNP